MKIITVMASLAARIGRSIGEVLIAKNPEKGFDGKNRYELYDTSGKFVAGSVDIENNK